MSWRRIFAIFRKDLFDAVRDSRILVTLLVPLFIGVAYSFAFDDTSLPSATLVVSDAGSSTLVDQISQAVTGELDLTVTRVDSADAVNAKLASEDADVGLVIPAGFDQAVSAGQNPNLGVYVGSSSSIGGRYVLATIEPILRQMAGQALPAQISVDTVAPDTSQLSIIDRMSMRTWSIVISLVLMIAMVAMLAIPIILAEETEKKTIDALVMVSSYGEVVIAKALLGMAYVGIMTAILLAITRLRPVDTAWFPLGLALTAFCLLGLGLLIGSVFKSATQLNTWSGLFLAPVIIPAAVIGLGLPHWLDRLAGFTPTGAGMKLLTNAFADSPLYTRRWEPIAVLVVWAIVFYGLLLWQLSRRRA